MVGCKYSNIGSQGAMLRRTRFLLQQLAAVRTWRLPARTTKATPSKKGLLLEEKPSENSSVAMATVIGNTYGLRVSTNHDAQGEDDDQGRIIAPGSPSFRIFFEDAAHREQTGKNEALKETDSPPDEAMPKKKVKRERKMKKHIKSVMSKRKEAVKNLLNVKACTCYHPSHRSTTLQVAENTTFS